MSWSAAISHAQTLGLISRAEFENLAVQRPTSADYLEMRLRFEEELRPIALAPAYAQAAVRAYRRGVISADRAVELLRNTISSDELPRPPEDPIEALVPEFDRIS